MQLVVLYCHYCKSCLKIVIFEMWVGTVKGGGREGGHFLGQHAIYVPKKLNNIVSCFQPNSKTFLKQERFSGQVNNVSCFQKKT